MNLLLGIVLFLLGGVLISLYYSMVPVDVNKWLVPENEVF